jgi:hypothetical protein
MVQRTGQKNDWKTAQMQEGHASVARSLDFAIHRDLGAAPVGWDPVSINHRKVSSFIEESLAIQQAISAASLVALIQTVKPEFPAVAGHGKSSDRSISVPFSGNRISEASAVQSWGIRNERAEHLVKVFSPDPTSESQVDSPLYVNFLLDRDQLIANGDQTAKLMTDEQHWALNQYTGSAFTDINRALRDTSSAEAQDPRIVGLITHALSGMKVLIEAGLVRQEGGHRGINNYQPTHDLKQGQVFRDSSFTSMSNDITIARNFSGESSQMNFATMQHIFGNEGVPVAKKAKYMNRHWSKLAWTPTKVDKAMQNHCRWQKPRPLRPKLLATWTIST